MLTTLDILTLLQAGFVQRAFIISIIIAVLCSVLSIFIVLKKISLIGDGLAHTAFGGIALGYAIQLVLGVYLQFVPLLVAAVTVVLGSLGITKAIRSTRISSDAAVAVFLQLGLAGGIVLISVSRGFGFSLESLLFGSVLLVDYSQIITSLIIAAVTLGIIFLFFKEIVYVTFDETQARASGLQNVDLRLLNQCTVRNRRNRGHTHSRYTFDILTFGFACFNELLKSQNPSSKQSSSHP